MSGGSGDRRKMAIEEEEKSEELEIINNYSRISIGSNFNVCIRNSAGTE